MEKVLKVLKSHEIRVLRAFLEMTPFALALPILALVYPILGIPLPTTLGTPLLHPTVLARWHAGTLACWVRVQLAMGLQIEPFTRQLMALQGLVYSL